MSYPLFLHLKPLQTRGHDRDRDWLPLDMNYAILECLENEPSRKASPVILYVLIFSSWNVLL